MKIAAYEENGVVITVHPAPALFDENSRDRVELAAMGIIFENEEEVYNFIFTKDIPGEKSFITMEDSELPEPAFRNAWEINNNLIIINLDKAKEITHAKRKEVRAEEFKPFDAIIALQIPGNDYNSAEAERVKIREKYAGIKEDINACTDVDLLKAIHDQLGA
jgi:hypothetical protein